MNSEAAKKDFYRRIPYTYGLFRKNKKSILPGDKSWHAKCMLYLWQKRDVGVGLPQKKIGEIHYDAADGYD